MSAATFRLLVGLDGLEPSTSRLSGARSSHLSYRPVFLTHWLYDSSLLDLRRDSEPLTRLRRVEGLLSAFVYAIFRIDGEAVASKNGGDEGIRTLDPLLAGQVLSQLSYTPIVGFVKFSNGP